MSISEMSIAEYSKLSDATAIIPKYQRDRRLHPLQHPKISKDNPYASIFSNCMWILFRDLIDNAPYSTLVNILHDEYCPCAGLLPKSLDSARNYIYREIKRKWTYREYNLFSVIETYFFPELETHCEACGRPDTLLYHHWVEDNGNKGDAYICPTCNSILQPKAFGMSKSHHMPSWDKQKEYVQNRLNREGI